MAVFGFESNYIDVEGIRTHYIEAGSGSEVLILVHGGGAGADGPSNYAHLMNEYGAHMRTIAVDMVGFGRSDKPSPDIFQYTQDTRTSHLIGFIEAMGFDKVNLIGNSMGGTTAFGVALKRADLVDKLVLMGAAVNSSSEILARRKQHVAPVLAYDFTVEGMRRILDCLTYDYVADEEYLHYRYEATLDPAAQAAGKAIMKWVGENGLCYSDAELGSLKCPVLVVGGKEDAMVPIELIHDMIDRIPQAYGYILPEAGHWVMIEKPKDFLNITLHFFSSIE